MTSAAAEKVAKDESIYASLARAQGAMKNPEKNKENPHFKSRYADLAAVLDQIRQPLAKEGIAIVQRTEFADGQMMYITSFRKGDESIDSVFPINDISTPQRIGSGITYARRYTLLGLAGIAADDDDDGHEASKTPAKTPSRGNVKRAANQPPAVKQSAQAVMSVQDRQKSAVQLIAMIESTKTVQALSETGRSAEFLAIAEPIKGSNELQSVWAFGSSHKKALEAQAASSKAADTQPEEKAAVDKALEGMGSQQSRDYRMVKHGTDQGATNNDDEIPF